MCRNLEVMYNPVSQYFPNDSHMVFMHGKKIHSKFKYWPMDYNLTEYKIFVIIVSDFTFQLAFKKLPLVKFSYNI